MLDNFMMGVTVISIRENPRKPQQDNITLPALTIISQNFLRSARNLLILAPLESPEAQLSNRGQIIKISNDLNKLWLIIAHAGSVILPC